MLRGSMLRGSMLRGSMLRGSMLRQHDRANQPRARGSASGPTEPAAGIGPVRDVRASVLRLLGRRDLTHTGAGMEHLGHGDHDHEQEHDHAHDEMDECIEACLQCHVICTMTAQYCLAEGGAHADVGVVGLLLDCAEMCQTSANFMVRGSPYHTVTCGACAELCRACADACRVFDGDENMAHCAEVCDACAASCGEMAVAAGEGTDDEE
jgi:hypothetical protein